MYAEGLGENKPLIACFVGTNTEQPDNQSNCIDISGAEGE